MLELILTRVFEEKLVKAAQGLKFLVLDELHTYRGRQGADVAMLVRRVRDAMNARELQCVGTSATMASRGPVDEQRKEVAGVASSLFGATVETQNVIGEALKRATVQKDSPTPAMTAELKRRVSDGQIPSNSDYRAFIADPLSSWIETKLGVQKEEGSDRLIRATPRSLLGPRGLAAELGELTGAPSEECYEMLKKALLAGYHCKDPDTGFPVFAFRVHQFLSKGDTVYASLESELNRYITTKGQRFVPGNRNTILLPLAFCRECGQEYYVVSQVFDEHEHQTSYAPRELSDHTNEDDKEIGFLYMSATDPWPSSGEKVLDRIPEDWIDESGGRRAIREARRKYVPKPVRVRADGVIESSGLSCSFIPSPFRFCISCGVSYGMRVMSDFGKLASLSSEGRSTATTVLSLSAILSLKNESSLKKEAKKLLSFTDNRQDASLQAGHFNDFVEIGLLRSALFKAVAKAGSQGIRHEALTQQVFEALAIPFSLYSSRPEAKYGERQNIDEALRKVLGYRLYRDLKRGWRVTSPNLEQSGLLQIIYPLLEEICEADNEWRTSHQLLASASPETRMKIAKVLLDFMRRDLAIKVDYLDRNYLEQVKQLSSQYLADPWAFDEKEDLEYASILFPRERRQDDFRGFVFLSARSGFGQYLRRSSTFPGMNGHQTTSDTTEVIRDLFRCLTVGGLVEKAVEAENERERDVPGYRLSASSMLWCVSDGSSAFHDPIRVPNLPEKGGRTNPFFIELYQNVAATALGIEAREHTAQVDSRDREIREERFKTGDLAILYCSPTMELGVDIASLNVVNLRNIPPTPANYAQRSGRAGRSGQPALVYSYCSTGSSHDQYFFKRPENMVAGVVAPPRLELANEDLIRGHVYAIWLSKAGLSLGKSLKDIVDVNGSAPSLELLPSVKDTLRNPATIENARRHAQDILVNIGPDLKNSGWYTEHWLDEVFDQIEVNFENSCSRWRDLYRAALKQAQAQDSIIRDATRSQSEKAEAERLRREAESQLRLLTDVQNIAQSDFYSYRYFASEGFLPGYNFPRLPISAYIPQRKLKQKDEFISRPRFLAISEFGPRAIVYHEGSKYIINKVIMPVGSDDVLTHNAKICSSCGYLHPESDHTKYDNCERCGSHLPIPMTSLFRMQNVVTKRRDRINSDEEERVRLGYEIITAVRFAPPGIPPRISTASLKVGTDEVAKLSYGHAATIWRINLGWSRRKEKMQKGFVLDIERGYWAKNDQNALDEDDPMSERRKRVIPYVEDRRNCLLFEPIDDLSEIVMASLQSALKNAIQVEYELEDNELATEPLPSKKERKSILVYEAAEGGAGVLRRLLDDDGALSRVFQTALRICHFDPNTTADLRRAPRSQEDCEAACYDCLMSYGNQADHELLDRQSIKELLIRYSSGKVLSAPGKLPRSEHIANLRKLAGSALEKKWLDVLEANNLRLPSRGQVFFEKCKTRPDFLYDQEGVAVYIDGPHHEYPERDQRDREQARCMEDAGMIVLRFGIQDDWLKTIHRYPNVFGAVK